MVASMISVFTLYGFSTSLPSSFKKGDNRIANIEGNHRKNSESLSLFIRMERLKGFHIKCVVHYLSFLIEAEGYDGYLAPSLFHLHRTDFLYTGSGNDDTILPGRILWIRPSEEDLCGFSGRPVNSYGKDIYRDGTAS